jgi:hypothetical protein
MPIKNNNGLCSLLEISKSETTPIFIPIKTAKKYAKINNTETTVQVNENITFPVFSYNKKNGSGTKTKRGFRTKEIISAIIFDFVMI